MYPDVRFFYRGGYRIKADYTLKYVAKKVVSFYISYLCVLVVLSTVALLCGYTFTLSGVIYEILCYKFEIMIFCWYVPFYGVLMLVLWVYSRFIAGKIVRLRIVLASGMYIVIKLIVVMSTAFEPLEELLSPLGSFYWVLILGYEMANYRVKIDVCVNKLCVKKRIVVGSLGLGLICLALYAHGLKPFIKGVSMGTVCVPMVVLGMYFLLTTISMPKMNQLLLFLGKHSMNIWFVHGLFYAEATKYVWQQIAYISQSPFIVVCWILLLSLMISVPLGSLQKIVLRLVN